MSTKQFKEMKMMRSSQVVLTLLLIVVCIGISGCVSVAPWERGILAKPHMAIVQNPAQTKLRAHKYSSREAGASVNSLGGGGGCGCY